MGREGGRSQTDQDMGLNGDFGYKTGSICTKQEFSLSPSKEHRSQLSEQPRRAPGTGPVEFKNNMENNGSNT